MDAVPAEAVDPARLAPIDQRPIIASSALDPPTTWLAARAPALRSQLHAWWVRHGRHAIPWKLNPDGTMPADGEPLDPYPIWVAEVMLQQTQLNVMLPYWRRWMERLPCAVALADAEEREVLLLWQGLGYYSRARRLHQGVRRLIAATAASLPGSEAAPMGDQASNLLPAEAPAAATPLWPLQLEDWLALPGLGRSTAASILSSAFDRPEAILDGNVRRVLARLIAAPEPPARRLALFWRLSEELLDPARPRVFNQALMDLGATVCTPRQPACPACPWQRDCAAYASGDPVRWPVKDAPRVVPFQVIGVGVVLDDSGRVLIDQRLNEGLLGGLWEFPGGKQEEGEPISATIERELAEELAIQVEVGEELISLDHAYSHKRLRFVVHLCRWLGGEPQPLACQQVRWVEPAALDEFPFPAANARIIAALRQRLGSCAAAAPEGTGAD